MRSLHRSPSAVSHADGLAGRHPRGCSEPVTAGTPASRVCGAAGEVPRRHGPIGPAGDDGVVALQQADRAPLDLPGCARPRSCVRTRQGPIPANRASIEPVVGRAEIGQPPGR
jgi:hypothetical protein